MSDMSYTSSLAFGSMFSPNLSLLKSCWMGHEAKKSTRFKQIPITLLNTLSASSNTGPFSRMLF